MNEERARQAAHHLHTAALEMIAAVRAVLDVAEELVRDGPPWGSPTGADGDGDGDADRITRINVDD